MEIKLPFSCKELKHMLVILLAVGVVYGFLFKDPFVFVMSGMFLTTAAVVWVVFAWCNGDINIKCRCGQ